MSTTGHWCENTGFLKLCGNSLMAFNGNVFSCNIHFLRISVLYMREYQWSIMTSHVHSHCKTSTSTTTTKAAINITCIKTNISIFTAIIKSSLSTMHSFELLQIQNGVILLFHTTKDSTKKLFSSCPPRSSMLVNFSTRKHRNAFLLYTVYIIVSLICIWAEEGSSSDNNSP